MYRIVEKKQLAQGIKLIKVKAPEISEKAKPGQFVILRLYEKGERIPLTINDFDPQQGTINIIFQEVGKTTMMLGRLNEGDYIEDIAGPLGKPTEIDNFGKVVCVGGGVGTAVIYPITRALYNRGNHIISIIGARSSDLLILEEEMKQIL